MRIYDIGIIGGGTAGMTAAIYGQRAGKQTILFEGTTFGGQITSSPNVENYPGIASVSGSEFSMNLMDQAVKLGTQTIMEQVTGIREEADYKVIVTTEKEYECKSIILATGVTLRHLGVPGEERLTGAGFHTVRLVMECFSGEEKLQLSEVEVQHSRMQNFCQITVVKFI